MSYGNGNGGGHGGGHGGGEGDGKGRSGSKFGRFGAKPKRAAKPEEDIDYKNISYLSKFVTPNGRIYSRKRTGFGGQDQRKLALAIKRARFVGLLPFVGRS